MAPGSNGTSGKTSSLAGHLSSQQHVHNHLQKVDANGSAKKYRKTAGQERAMMDDEECKHDEAGDEDDEDDDNDLDERDADMNDEETEHPQQQQVQQSKNNGQEESFDDA